VLSLKVGARLAFPSQPSPTGRVLLYLPDEMSQLASKIDPPVYSRKDKISTASHKRLTDDQHHILQHENSHQHARHVLLVYYSAQAQHH
jgi:hypothetical protein